MIKLRAIGDTFSNFALKLSAVKFFVAISFCFGILFILITPPFQTPDEPVHFYRAYQISNFNFVVDTNKGQPVGGELPDSLGDTVLLTATNPTIQFTPNSKYDIHKTRQALSLKEDSSDREPYDFSATALYSPIAYIPQAAGIGLARLFRLPPVVMMYAGRLANLLAWILMLSLVIHLMPRRKWAVAVIGLLPMAIFQAGSLSTDVMAVGSAFLFVAYILKIREQKLTISWRQIGVIAAISTCLLLSKQVMIVLLPLLLLLPAAKLGGKRSAILKVMLAAVAPIAFMLTWSLLTKNVDATTTFTNGQNPAQQIKFVLQNPHSFINVLWNTNFFNWGDGVTRSLIGTFGWMDTPLSEAITVLGYVSLLIAIVVSTDKTSKIKRWLMPTQKLLVFLVAVGLWVVVDAALYALYSPVGFKIIVGLQGRYFLPIVLLLVPLLHSKVLISSSRFYRMAVICLPTFLLASSLITIYFRYYINNV